MKSTKRRIAECIDDPD
ncbi:hypothetical protein MTR67_044310 [Solanum verrucosum]|uniref:Uncharacterized protein n=1 Tax=Solanum verrucosum TaxID=315347 RepID=A0AAF0US02_SOLVR|nr:hypothetical protein MTR67_044310 [Solanum verrucosum]